MAQVEAAGPPATGPPSSTHHHAPPFPPAPLLPLRLQVGCNVPSFVRIAMEAYGDCWPNCLGMFDAARLVAGLGRHGVYPRSFMAKVCERVCVERRRG